MHTYMCMWRWGIFAKLAGSFSYCHGQRSLHLPGKSRKDIHESLGASLVLGTVEPTYSHIHPSCESHLWGCELHSTVHLPHRGPHKSRKQGLYHTGVACWLHSWPDKATNEGVRVRGWRWPGNFASICTGCYEFILVQTLYEILASLGMLASLVKLTGTVALLTLRPFSNSIIVVAFSDSIHPSLPPSLASIHSSHASILDIHPYIIHLSI